MKYLTTFLQVIFFSFMLPIHAQWTYPPHIEGAEMFTYKKIDDIQLNLWVFSPSEMKAEKKVPAVVFFFGGGWTKGSPAQFVEHCKYLKARGMVAIVADYRVKSRHGVAAYECVMDAKSAIRWVREHAAELGIDSQKIVAAGGSAGGHLAASTAILQNFDEATENVSLSSKPNALILFNPVLVLPPVDDSKKEIILNNQQVEEKFGTSLSSISPYHHIRAQLPPTLIFHGTNDTTVSFASAEMFTRKMHEYGNDCTLYGYNGEPHGFFNYGKKSNAVFIDTVYKMDQFLVSIGYLQAPPMVKVW